MELHWVKRRLADTGKTKRYVIHLSDESGTLQGYVRNTRTGAWEGYVGRPGKLIGIFGSSTEAKEAVITEGKFT